MEPGQVSRPEPGQWEAQVVMPPASKVLPKTTENAARAVADDTNLSSAKPFSKTASRIRITNPQHALRDATTGKIQAHNKRGLHGRPKRIRSKNLSTIDKHSDNVLVRQQQLAFLLEPITNEVDPFLDSPFPSTLVRRHLSNGQLHMALLQENTLARPGWTDSLRQHLDCSLVLSRGPPLPPNMEEHLLRH
jgi:hypothetical protein